MDHLKMHFKLDLKFRYRVILSIICILVCIVGCVGWWKYKTAPKWVDEIMYETTTVHLSECISHNHYREKLEYDLSQEEIKKLLIYLQEAEKQPYYMIEQADYSLDICENKVHSASYLLAVRVGDDHYITVINSETNEQLRSDKLETFLGDLIAEHEEDNY